jgi:hypothetical protein
MFLPYSAVAETGKNCLCGSKPEAMAMVKTETILQNIARIAAIDAQK